MSRKLLRSIALTIEQDSALRGLSAITRVPVAVHIRDAIDFYLLARAVPSARLSPAAVTATPAEARPLCADAEQSVTAVGESSAGAT